MKKLQEELGQEFGRQAVLRTELDSAQTRERELLAVIDDTQHKRFASALVKRKAAAALGDDSLDALLYDVAAILEAPGAIELQPTPGEEMVKKQRALVEQLLSVSEVHSPTERASAYDTYLESLPPAPIT